MNRAKDGNCFLMAHWKTIYESGQEVRIKKLIKGLFDYGGWSGLHIALWTWLAIDGKREKEEWFKAFDVPEVKHYCFACEQAEMSFYLPTTKSTSEEEDYINPSLCDYCPLKNPSSKECLNGLYYKWLLKADLEGREDLARKIATMEWIVK